MRIKKEDLKQAREAKAITQVNYRNPYTCHELAQMVKTNAIIPQAAFKILTEKQTFIGKYGANE